MVSGEIDAHQGRELQLFIENDGDLYRSHTQWLIKNYAKKVKKKTFNKDLAVKGFLITVTQGITRYNKEFGSIGQVNSATKQEIAKRLLSVYMDEIQDEASKL